MTEWEKAFFDHVIGVLWSEIQEEEWTIELLTQLMRGAQDGLEMGEAKLVSPSSVEEWAEKRFKYQFVWLDRNDYAKALVRALWLAPVFAGTDFGSSRQRDMGQVWTDTARGFLGEIAVSKFLLEKFNMNTRLEVRRGELTDFLPTDIAQVQFPGGQWYTPQLRISVKTTKFNGRWLDCPGAQFGHSDVFTLVKIGILRQHFLGFLKAISFLRDKLFVTAKDIGELSDEDAETLWCEIPEFKPMPAYIAGFIRRSDVNLPIHMINARLKGTKHKRLLVSQGVGLFSPETVRGHPEVQGIDPSGRLPIEIEPMIEALTGTHFFAHSGGLSYGAESWQELVESLRTKK